MTLISFVSNRLNRMVRTSESKNHQQNSTDAKYYKYSDTNDLIKLKIEEIAENKLNPEYKLNKWLTTKPYTYRTNDILDGLGTFDDGFKKTESWFPPIQEEENSAYSGSPLNSHGKCVEKIDGPNPFGTADKKLCSDEVVAGLDGADGFDYQRMKLERVGGEEESSDGEIDLDGALLGGESLGDGQGEGSEKKMTVESVCGMEDGAQRTIRSIEDDQGEGGLGHLKSPRVSCKNPVGNPGL